MPPSAIHMDQIRTRTQHLQSAALERQPAAETAKPEKAEQADKGEGMSFWDVLDVVNPLQHIPGVNKIYQAITGDTIRTPAKIAGAALFFGPVGIALASADAVLEQETGKDALGHVTSTLGLDKDAPAEAPAEDDPFTVTAPRLRTADATPAPPAEPAIAAPLPPSSGPIDLSAGQAALLERLMNGGGQALPTAPASAATVAAPAAPAPAAVTATSISAHAPAAGGIATARQLKDLETTPGASAALTAARGMGSAAVVASLPAPGASGAGDNLLAAMEQDQQRAKSPNMGRGLADYRAAAISSGSMQIKPVVASRANQMARAAGANMPGANVAAPSTMTTRTAQPQPQAATATSAPAPTPAAAATTVQAEQPAAWPPGGATPLPKDLIADMMTRAMDKYQANGRGTAPAAATGGTLH